MSDLISRQAAIDAIEKKSDEIYKTKQDGATFPHDDLFQGMAYAEDVVKRLPSAQPEPCEDAVSRQEVTDILENADPDLYVDLFNKLPSVTPKPKRGRWIEDKGQQTLMQNFIEKGEVWRVCSVCGAGHMIGHKYECDKAYHETYHNFCPNCGADMRGEQNG